MNRRGFLGLFASALLLDPERLLYVPGKKLISIPKPQQPLIISTAADTDLVYDAMRILGLLYPNETLSAEGMSLGLRALHRVREGRSVIRAVPTTSVYDLANLLGSAFGMWGREECVRARNLLGCS